MAGVVGGMGKRRSDGTPPLRGKKEKRLEPEAEMF